MTEEKEINAGAEFDILHERLSKTLEEGDLSTAMRIVQRTVAIVEDEQIKLLDKYGDVPAIAEAVAHVYVLLQCVRAGWMRVLDAKNEGKVIPLPYKNKPGAA